MKRKVLLQSKSHTATVREKTTPSKLWKCVNGDAYKISYGVLGTEG